MAHILIVDGVPDTLTVTETILRNAGHTVFCETDGLDALRTAARHRPDLILIDLSLRHMDGIETTRRLKASPATAHIPIIACTAQSQRATVARALEVGCAALLPKPFLIDELLAMVDEVLGYTSDWSAPVLG
ncbi:MAG TPA: response regulator [Roseiflexaceae bacterium]|nr:response regulator [Roseiflexaceae bacterium]